MDTDDLKFPFDEKKLGKEKTLCVAESKGSKAGCHFVPTGRAQFSLGGKWSTGGGKKKKKEVFEKKRWKVRFNLSNW